MKKIFYSTIFLISNFCFSQNLSIEETINYINSIEPSDYSSFISVDKYGVMKFKDFWVWETIVDYKDVELEKRENIGTTNVMLICKYNSKCVKSTNRKGESNFSQSFMVKQLKDRENANKVYNAMEYLLKLIKERPVAVEKNDDPFSTYNYKK
ncbi:hypothetical protein G6R40_02720 [Chryseobacterium sp. POL2]|uniref:hypothetical protein n=1 Tax=Chryseobacterium sp. POL2 TaxID=2713414 RepID=UPI0013E19E0E|nr:hypothetical protein [Chryseobacterium sp. POL2]QIG88644.1 hypothetical protein G6R40_02720 [Chryseobacterium sp. POL2]